MFDIPKNSNQYRLFQKQQKINQQKINQFLPQKLPQFYLYVIGLIQYFQTTMLQSYLIMVRLITSQLNNNIIACKFEPGMAKYKIERQYIFSTKPYAEICEFLAEYKDVNLLVIRDHKGNTALHQAAYNNDDIRVLKKYLDYMEKFYGKNQLQNPKSKFCEFVNSVNQDGLTALHFAAYKGNFKALEILSSYGADYTITTTSGQNVLHLAAQGGMVESFIFFQSLLDINCKDSKLSTPLHWAAYMNSESIITFLLAQPTIEVNAKDSKQQTPLHLATSYGHTKIVKKLLRAGADRKIIDQKSMTALQIAKNNEFHNIERILNDQYSCLDYLKLYMNLKTVYKPEARSCMRPFLYILSLLGVIALRILLFVWQDQFKYVSYIEYGFCGLVLLLYLSLLSGPKKTNSKKYITFLQGNIPMKKVCLACSQLKPPRSMHCEICKTCIQRYDHHCFWINNCVGKRNMGRFILFILAFQLLLLFYLGLSILVLVNWFDNSKAGVFAIQEQTWNICAIIFAFGLGCVTLGFIFPMMALIIVHIKNLLLNKTTYQRFTKDRISALTESTSHLLEQEMMGSKSKKYSFANARTMCRDEDDTLDNENSGSLNRSER